MNEDELEQKLTERVRKAINRDLSDVGSGDEELVSHEPRDEHEERSLKQSTKKRPMQWDPRESEFFFNNRDSMGNDELKKFLEGSSDFQESLEDQEEWDEFSRDEERKLVTMQGGMQADQIAEELGRDEEEVKLKMRMMGMRAGF
ncbi:MAG: hypothetical protein H8Z69_01235 [Nanohaloarchaea archaeon]|nr:hypothetical protein [Candidatus Nanohaloarchaea archaeon]